MKLGENKKNEFRDYRNHVKTLYAYNFFGALKNGNFKFYGGFT